MSEIESRLDRLEAHNAAREILLQALLAHAINEASDAPALIDGLRRGIDRVLALPEWQDGRSDHAQAAVRQEINEAFGRAGNALKHKQRAQILNAAREDHNKSETTQ